MTGAFIRHEKFSQCLDLILGRSIPMKNSLEGYRHQEMMTKRLKIGIIVNINDVPNQIE